VFGTNLTFALVVGMTFALVVGTGDTASGRSDTTLEYMGNKDLALMGKRVQHLLTEM